MLTLISYIGLFGPICIAVVGVSFVSSFSRLFDSYGTVVSYERKIG